MRSTAVLAVAAAVYAVAALGAEAGAPALPNVQVTVLPQPTGKVVYLYTSAQLEQLRKDNPRHYAQAERILAAGSKLCSPGRDTVIPVGLNVHDLQCNSMALRTSLPPKVDLHFRLDDTVYIARAVVTDARANAVKVK
jgi:hypothetical protein